MKWRQVKMEGDCLQLATSRKEIVINNTKEHIK